MTGATSERQAPLFGRLSGQGALITGSSTGIGECIARRFASEGAHVLVQGRDQHRTTKVAADLRDCGCQASATTGDLGDPSFPEELARRAVQILGGVDILVNNAAISTRSNLETTDASMFDQIIAVNLRAPLLLIRSLLRHFRSRGSAAILNIGSSNAYCGEPELLAYSISKGGLMTLSRNLSDALAKDGIRVNHLNLGWVLTPNEYELKCSEGLPSDWPNALPKSFAPSGALLAPEDIAHFALAFVEQSSHRVSGSVVDLEQYPIIGRNPPKVPSPGTPT